jgi:hypothetical protein
MLNTLRVRGCIRQVKSCRRGGQVWELDFHLRQWIFARRKKARMDAVRAFLVEPLARCADSAR